jgi:hypothetical protein
MTATTTVVMIGSPAGNNGVTTMANAIEATATTRKKFDCSRGHNRPKNAAGTAASKPHDAGLPSALAPRAPSSVKIFQKMKTPVPVIQKPSRIAPTPRRAWESATPVDSSIVICAATTRRTPFTFNKGAIWIP